MNREAQFYIPQDDGAVKCTLCPHFCLLKVAQSGICRVRKNKDSRLVTEVYDYVSSINSDPVEKKPLYHFYPGSMLLSIGTYGCNLRCSFCQNCSISQTSVDNALPRTYYTPEQIIQIALENPEVSGIAFTYNEPAIWFEYMFEIARLAKQAGLVTVMVTNGYINPEPLNVLLEYIDAFSVDLKGFTEDFYRKITSSKLEPVKSTLKQLALAGKHIEIVNLVIPGLNDDDEIFRSMIKWISEEIGKDTVLHISRYFPNYKLDTEATPFSIMRRLKQIAEKELNYVYIGNTQADNDTKCIKCDNLLISRNMYQTTTIGLDKQGRCNSCGDIFIKKLN